jgi:hypothetical protein
LTKPADAYFAEMGFQAVTPGCAHQARGSEACSRFILRNLIRLDSNAMEPQDCRQTRGAAIND